VKFGEGPTEVNAGHHSEAKNADFTSQDIRFTQKGDVLYAISLAVPADGKFLIKSLAGYEREITSVTGLGTEIQPGWTLTEEGLLVDFKGEIQAKDAFAIKIQ